MFHTAFRAALGAVLLLGFGLSPASAQAADAESIVLSLQAAGLPVLEPRSRTADNDANHLLGRPHQYTGKADWRDARSTWGGEPGVLSGGTVEVFADEQDRLARQQYIEAVARQPIFAEYTYGCGLVLLRLSKELTPAQAAEYQQAMLALGVC